MITEQEEKIPQVIEMLFGQKVLKYSIILFTHGDQLKGKSMEQTISENSRLKYLVDQCGGRYQVFNNKDQKNRKQINDLEQKSNTMIKQNRGGHYSNQMFEDAWRFRQEERKRRLVEKERRWREEEEEKKRGRETERGREKADRRREMEGGREKTDRIKETDRRKETERRRETQREREWKSKMASAYYCSAAGAYLGGSVAATVVNEAYNATERRQRQEEERRQQEESEQHLRE
ncbi:hypothetical protein QQF64_025717 [Cirrhinus molitorella]|uniref:AIG1-type G domain-containing protein n=1 Tax=Cirrhinus molitorella TaxID=172907 RepID=A0ABR3NPT7_9TELE